MTAPGGAPEPPARVVPRRVVPRGKAPGIPSRPKLRLVRDGGAGEAPLPGGGTAPAEAAAAPPPRLPEWAPPGAAVPVVVYLLAVTVCGTTGLVAGLSLFGTLSAAVLAYLGAGFAGLAGAGLLARGVPACRRRGPQCFPTAGAEVTEGARRPNGKP